MKHTFPADYDSAACYVVAINASLIPIVAGSLEYLQQRYAWVSDADYQHGYNAIAELRACLMQTCINDLIESNDRLYRMLDTALFGRAYTVDSLEPLVVNPPIAPTHDLAVEHIESVLGRMEVNKQLLENALNGTETPMYNRENGVRDLLEQLITALQETDNLDAEMLEQLTQIVALLA